MSYTPPNGFLQVPNNLSDVSSVSTSRVSLGLGTTQNVSFDGIFLTGTTGGGYYYVPRQSAYNVLLATGLLITCSPTDQAVFDTQANKKCILDFNSIATSDKTFTFPNSSGTIALTSGVPSLPISKANGGFGADVSTGLTNDFVAIVAGNAITIGAVTSASLTTALSTSSSINLAAGNSLTASAGAGALTLGSMTGASTLPTGSLSWSGAAGKNWSLTEGIATSGTSTGLTWTGGAHTGLTASTDIPAVNFNLAQTVQHATGALATQRAFVVQAPTYSFVGASTLTKAATFAITGAPATGTNATITNSYSLWVQAGKAQFDGALTIANGQTATLPGTTNGPGGGSTWTLNNPTSGAIDLQSASVSYWLINDSGNPNAIALGSGKSIVGIAGAGGLNFGSMTGDWSMPTGTASWTGASSKTLTLTTSSGSNLTMGSNVTLSASGGLSVSGGSGISIQHNGTTVASTTSTSILAMSANKSFNAAAGTGGFGWGSATGDSAFSTGNHSWAGASGKTLSLQSTAATITIQSLTSGTVLIDSAAILNLGTAAATSVNVGRSGQSIGFFGTTATTQQVDGYAITNNVTNGGILGTIANFTDLTIYANDANAIRNDIYQISAKLKIIDDALRLYGLLT